ncbi:MAG: hypothetical protein M3N17_09420 [Actinomycetota bacterium]|nr:hypothetical protein [Actinomycetota bacterium]
MWCVWLADGLWFRPGSLARHNRHNLALNDRISVHLEAGDEVGILEGVARRVTDPDGNAGPASRVAPRVVFGWRSGMASPTRWRFPPATTPS